MQALPEHDYDECEAKACAGRGVATGLLQQMWSQVANRGFHLRALPADPHKVQVQSWPAEPETADLAFWWKG
eukprot:9236515-Alexandrium_andersonii.AAC.1